jgi:hypothetical protein
MKNRPRDPPNKDDCAACQERQGMPGSSRRMIRNCGENA